MGSSFLVFSLANPGRAATQEVAVADKERGCQCSSWLEHVDEDFEVKSPLRREFARGNGSYMRKPRGLRRRLPSPRARGLLTHSLWSGE